MKALTAAEMREVDRLTTERFGIPSLQLMENAGRKAANAARRFVAGHENARVCVLCGKGNNGGDGFVVARHLELQDYAVPTRVLLFGRPEDVRGDAAANLARWRDAGNPIDIVNDASDWTRLWPEVASSAVIIDALLGTGLRGAPTGAIAQAIANINNLSRNATAPTPALILAVDTPSGLPSDGEPALGHVLFAHRTVTFTAPKIGQLLGPQADTCGVLEVVSIGSPPELIEELGKGPVRWATPDEFRWLPLVRGADSNKGKYGHVLLLAGSACKSGAAALSGLGALRTGAGLVTIATAAFTQAPIAAAHPEYMTEAIEATPEGAVSAKSLQSEAFARILAGKTVLAVGPGLGTHPETQELITRVVADSELPIILDADGLNAFAGNAESLRRRKSQFLAVTPHPGEMARLLGSTTAEVQKNRVAVASEAAQKCNAHVILKGFHTLIASPDGQLFVNSSGNPGLAKGGSGDVLTGILAALTAQFGTEDWIRVLTLGVYLHGIAADLLATYDKDISGMLASEVANTIPEARDLLLREIRFGA
jgi:ADP-dependent NAD(P)H-hydrate dehydratase / NAD(P)H-hydrate epimerase